jgi:hypothetical protein
MLIVYESSRIDGRHIAPHADIAAEIVKNALLNKQMGIDGDD